MKIKSIAYRIIALFCILFLTINYAQAIGMGMGGGGGTPPCGGPFPPCPIPLDSNIALLLIAGAAYGGYRIFNSFKKNPV